jgi:hypothetical protein
MAEANHQGFFDRAADIDRQWEDAEKQCQDLVQELTLLQTRGSKLCLAIVGLPRVWGHLFEGMRIAIICHTEMARQLAALRATMSFVAQSILGCSPSEAF